MVGRELVRFLLQDRGCDHTNAFEAGYLGTACLGKTEPFAASRNAQEKRRALPVEEM